VRIAYLHLDPIPAPTTNSEQLMNNLSELIRHDIEIQLVVPTHLTDTPLPFPMHEFQSDMPSASSFA